MKWKVIRKSVYLTNYHPLIGLYHGVNIYLGSLYVLKCHAVYAIITKIITYNLCDYEITT